MVRSLRCFLAIALVFGVGAVAHAQTQLVRKYKDGESYSTSVDVISKQTMNILGMNQETSSQQNMVIKSQVGRRGADGQLRVDHKVDAMQVELKVPVLGEIKFDSAKPDSATESPITPLLKAGAKGSWTEVLDKDNRVVAIEGREKALEGVPDELKERAKAQIDPAYLKEAANRQIDRIPSKPLKPNDSWEQTETMRIDGGQTLTFKKTYTYKGPETVQGVAVDRIDVKATEVKLEINFGGAIPLKLVKSDLKIGESKGVIHFDRNVGRVIFDDQSHQIKGPLTLGIGDQEIPADIDLNLTTTSRERR